MTNTSLMIAAVVPLVAWRIYSRVRRNIGRQKSRLWRHWTAAIAFPLLLVLFALAALASAVAEGALATGVAAGVALAVWGLRLTRFERAADGFFYTPNAYLGAALSVLLVARVLYRLFELYSLGGTLHAQGAEEIARSPVTLLIIGVVFGYYAAYSMGLVRWRHAARV
jgi:hypothetical protein